jgi:2-oxo-4-hydroxy-4-carboxy-5-ureidoimidazoline decarboxylase
VTVAELNALPEAEAAETLERCCGSRAWVGGMLARRPFRDRSALLEAGETVWRGLAESDWREAFSHHPKIGDIESLRSRFATTAAWAVGEQAGTAGASDTTLTRLADGNRAYEERFGYIFIVCATGKSAAEMSILLEQRLENDPATELPVAAAEQAKILRLRLEKLVSA